ncbi:MAG: outer membrane protein transport protein [Flavobacterium sp.]|nr:outer membrane protein transport protein [Flavobacterium sp.]
MNKYLSIFAICLCMNAVQGQEISDAMQYAQDNLNGTARFRALGGAFGALGGDFSSLNVNPAGSAFFLNNTAALTLTSQNIKNKSNYFGTGTAANDNTIDLNQAGAAWIFEDFDQASNWKKITLAMNYENTTSFNNTIYSNGNNPTNSVANYFTSYANGYTSNALYGNFLDLNYAQQQGALGLAANIISPAGTGNVTEYESMLTGNGNFYQKNLISSSGYNGKLSFNAATSYRDKLFLGINLNSHFADFTKYSRFYEDYADSSGHNTASGVQSLVFKNELQTYGTGFSFQAGAIVKVVKGLRVGLSYESPTWYRLNDKLRQTLTVDCPDCAANDPAFYATQVSENEYPTYKLKTPGRYTGSIAYIFGKSGLLSFDYTVKDYTNTKFKPQTDYNDLNTLIGNTFDKTSEFRIGGEYRIKQWSLRGGYRFEQSPYKDNTTIGHLNSYSGGLGYNFGNTKVDLAYTLAKRNFNQAFFAQGLTDAAAIRSRSDNVSVTVVLEL